MTTTRMPHSGTWVSFTYANFIGSLGLTAVGIFFLPLDVWMKGYLAMGVAMAVSSAISLAKTLRDIEEAAKLVNKIEDAKAEQLLMRMEHKPA